MGGTHFTNQSMLCSRKYLKKGNYKGRYSTSERYAQIVVILNFQIFGIFRWESHWLAAIFVVSLPFVCSACFAFWSFPSLLLLLLLLLYTYIYIIYIFSFLSQFAGKAVVATAATRQDAFKCRGHRVGCRQILYSPMFFFVCIYRSNTDTNTCSSNANAVYVWTNHYARPSQVIPLTAPVISRHTCASHKSLPPSLHDQHHGLFTQSWNTHTHTHTIPHHTSPPPPSIRVCRCPYMACLSPLRVSSMLLPREICWYVLLCAIIMNTWVRIEWSNCVPTLMMNDWYNELLRLHKKWMIVCVFIMKINN